MPETIWLSDREIREALERANKPVEPGRRGPLEPEAYLDALNKQRNFDRWRAAQHALRMLGVKGDQAKSTAIAASVGPQGISGIWVTQKTNERGQSTFALHRVDEPNQTLADVEDVDFGGEDVAPLATLEQFVADGAARTARSRNKSLTHPEIPPEESYRARVKSYNGPGAALRGPQPPEPDFEVIDPRGECAPRFELAPRETQIEMVKADVVGIVDGLAFAGKLRDETIEVLNLAAEGKETPVPLAHLKAVLAETRGPKGERMPVTWVHSWAPLPSADPHVGPVPAVTPVNPDNAQPGAIHRIVGFDDLHTAAFDRAKLRWEAGDEVADLVKHPLTRAYGPSARWDGKELARLGLPAHRGVK
jgi:hypothetical protein